MRNLAQRSAQAAREIKGLIKESSGKVNEGAELVNEAVNSKNIVESVSRVNSSINQINDEAQEQKASIQQVFKAIADIDDNYTEECSSGGRNIYRQFGSEPTV